MDPRPPQIYFSDFFGVAPQSLEEYGAFNVSLINDLPLFVDPFLLFNSDDPVYRQLHDEIIRYLRFLRDRSRGSTLDLGLIASWYQFKEIKQNWLGFSRSGNRGSGLGPTFARALHRNLGTIFSTFGEEQITRGSHLEKVCLVDRGVGRDNISDFTTNLIKGHLLDYTQRVAQACLTAEQRCVFAVEKVRFNYDTETWASGRYELPNAAGDYVLLTPKDMLTRDETWISRPDLLHNFERVAAAVPNFQLRAQLNNYFYNQLIHDPTMTADEREKEKQRAIARAIMEYPEIIEYYIREREDWGDEACDISSERVEDTQAWFVDQVRSYVADHLADTTFYTMPANTRDETRDRILFLKHVIEDQGGHRLFYRGGEAVQRESDLQIIFKFVWFASPSAVDAEVNNGRGPVDFSISRGSDDKTLVEFKLARNSKLKQGLAKQVKIYEAAGAATGLVKVICYFWNDERERAQKIIRELGLEDDPNIILIDASNDKPSASTA
ncbi:MAG TPA: hypothetical protein VMM78_14515 [Thermomicrobiales bacterium]|nr:hypothetical protein [Thermomicrobiales bacterium]